MLRGVAHVHFREGERGPQEATLGFDEGLAILERHSVEEAVVTFHVRHPSDLRPATPGRLLERIEEYRGPVKIVLMPEANVVFSAAGPPNDPAVWHDIGAGDEVAGRVAGWIVSIHFTQALGWTKNSDEEHAPEQTFACAARVYEKVMRQDWRGWIGHPFRWCGGGDAKAALRRTLRAAVETGRIVEIPVQDYRRGTPSGPMLQPSVIAEFPARPLVAISTDAHHADQLNQRLEASSRLAEWLLSEGVRPEQLWGWRS